MNRLNKISFTVLAVLLMAGPAYSQSKDIIQLQVDVINLKEQMKEMQSSMDANNSLLKGLLEKTLDQVNGLSSSIQKINQTVDNVNSHGDKSTADLRTQLTTMNSHLSDLSDSVSALKSQLSSVSQQVADAKTTSVALPSSGDALKAAKVDLAVGNYALAISELNDIIAKFPSDSAAMEAQYDLGMAYYNQKSYDQADTQFDVYLQKYPENDMSKGALYYKGLALIGLNQRGPAVKVFQEVISKYPGTVEASNAQLEIKKPAAGAARRTP